MLLTVNINRQKILNKVTNDNFGRFASVTWKKLIDPYVPKNTGQLMQNVDVLPFALHYKENYANAVYNMRNAKFKKINPYSTYEWDVAAEKAGQKTKLYRTLNSALRSGRF